MSVPRDADASWTKEILDAVRQDIKDDTRFNSLPTDALSDVWKGLAKFLYVMDPVETSFERTEQVPNFFRQAWPFFLFFIILEHCILLLKRKPALRLNDTVTSLSNGLALECGRLIFRGAESLAYVYIYDNYRVANLPWDSATTWYAAALGVDFCYYWVHRASHEIHILWAQHQVHHSSEEFNLAVGLRQSILHSWCGFIFYLPLAVVIPPAHFLTHQQFSLLYQFWIHTKTISSLGPFEYILNTPKHHRVHHGCNKYCLDKNYGGVLIIWDRIFGTFAEERKEDIVYGLVFNQPSFNPLHLQTFYSHHVAKTVISYQNWKHRLAAVFYGPSWSPGKPRLGEEREKMDIKARDKYDVKLPLWCNVYLLVHFCAVVYGFQELALRHMGMSPLSVLLFVAYILASLTAIGMMFDQRPGATTFELLRCACLAFACRSSSEEHFDRTTLLSAQLFFVTSAIWWCLEGLNFFNSKKRKLD